MNFLAPLFLLGALAIAGPVIFHLIRRTTREVTPFSSLMFLHPTPPRVTRRSRLENLWLLLLRCLAVILLACGFARPFLRTESISAESPSGVGKRLVILLDTSASMRREKLWEEARSKASELLRKSFADDQIALLTFDRDIQTVVNFEEWKTMNPGERAPAAMQRLAGLSPTWSGTQLGAALIHAAELIEEFTDTIPRAREIVVISDLQEGARVDGLQHYEWPKGLSVRLEPVRGHQLQNAGVQWVPEGEDAAGSAHTNAARLRVTNSADSKREQFHIQWEKASLTGAEPAKLEAYVPAGQSRIVRAPKPPAESSSQLTLTGDEVEFDNSLFVIPPNVADVPLLFVGQDAAADPGASLYYLQRAFPKTLRQNVEIIVHRGDRLVPSFQIQQAQLLVLGDAVSDACLPSVRQFAQEGKIVLFPLTSAVSARALGILFEAPQLVASEALVKDYALLSEINFQHPLFTPFADPRFSDFTKIHFWKYRKLDTAPLPRAQILARFDSGDPAIVQVPLGRGSIVVVSTSWRPIDSQLALSSKFVPLLHALLEQSSNLPGQKAQYFVGDEVALPSGSQPLTIRKPDGTEVPLGGASKFTETDQPGVYLVAPGTLRFVVNLAPEESRIAPLLMERLTTLGLPLETAIASEPLRSLRGPADAQAADLENRQKLWRWLIIAALGVLLLETFIAGKLSSSSGRLTDAQT